MLHVGIGALTTPYIYTGFLFAPSHEISYQKYNNQRRKLYLLYDFTFVITYSVKITPSRPQDNLCGVSMTLYNIIYTCYSYSATNAVYVCRHRLFVMHHARQQPSGRVRESLNAGKYVPLSTSPKKTREQDNVIVSDRQCVHTSWSKVVHTYNES